MIYKRKKKQLHWKHFNQYLGVEDMFKLSFLICISRKFRILFPFITNILRLKLILHWKHFHQYLDVEDILNLLIKEIQNTFFIYYKHFKTETYIIEQKKIMIYCFFGNKLTISFNNFVFFPKLIWCSNHYLEHIQRDHVQRLLPWKRTHCTISKLCLIH